MREPGYVLCLEDDPLDAELLENAVRSAVPDVRWRTARTRRDFEGLLLAECPDLVLADYRLPDTDGLAALDFARAKWPEVPFVVVSGAITEAFAIEALKRGASDYVLKQRLQRLGPVAARALAESRTRRELRDYQRLAVEIGDREQERLGADLHDAVGQDLAAVALLVEAAVGQSAREAPALHARLVEAERLLARATRGLRGIARTLSPVDLWPGSLAPALRSLARDAEALYGLACTVEVSGDTEGLAPDIVSHLYRVAQEALTNAAKHGRAQRARLRFVRTPEELELEVVDDGTGIDPARVRAAEGLGLRLMEYRARVIGARLQVGPGPGGGTVVRLVRAATAR